MTPFSDALRERAAAGDSRPAQARPSRIITARELPGYAPFPLDSLGVSEPAGDTRPGDRNLRFVPLDTRLRPIPASTDGDLCIDPAAARQQAYEAGHAAGHQVGHAEGFELGVAAASERLQRERLEREAQAGASLEHRIATLSTGLAAGFGSIEAQAADELVELAIAVARQALGASLALQPETISEVVREALSGLLAERSQVRLRLNPADVALVREALGRPLDEAGCEIVASAEISRGGCLVEAPQVEIDALVETRWRRTLAALGRRQDGKPVDRDPGHGPEPGSDASAAFDGADQ
jgi:flagellar assembly protein FliH